MLKILVLLSILLIVADVVLCKPDYIYIYQVNGWMKFHKIPVNWHEAYLKCHFEGAVLASPVDELMVTALQGLMTENSPDVPIHIGVHSKFSEGDFLTIEGVRLADMPVRWGRKEQGAETGDCLVMSTAGRAYHMSTSSCNDRHPYICFKPYGINARLNQCGTFDNGYQLDQRTGSCYKVHKNIQTWSRAHSICIAEGGHLVILNNEEEANIVNAMIPNRPDPGVWDGSHIGLREWNDNGNWFTVHGQAVNSVYNKWEDKQPDKDNATQQCGTLLRIGPIDGNSCDSRAAFVCEKVPSFTRFGPANYIEILN